MPKVDGIDATKMIRAILKDKFKLSREEQPVIIGITGHVLDKFKKGGLKAGMDEILSKPLYSNVLKSILLKYNII